MNTCLNSYSFLLIPNIYMSQIALWYKKSPAWEHRFKHRNTNLFGKKNIHGISLKLIPLPKSVLVYVKAQWLFSWVTIYSNISFSVTKGARRQSRESRKYRELSVSGWRITRSRSASEALGIWSSDVRHTVTSPLRNATDKSNQPPRRALNAYLHSMLITIYHELRPGRVPLRSAFCQFLSTCGAQVGD